MSDHKYPDFGHELKVANERSYDGVSGMPDLSPQTFEHFQKLRGDLFLWAYQSGYAMCRDSETPLRDAAMEVFGACERNKELKQSPHRRLPTSLNDKMIEGIDYTNYQRIPHCARLLVDIKRSIEQNDKAGLANALVGQNASAQIDGAAIHGCIYNSGNCAAETMMYD